MTEQQMAGEKAGKMVARTAVTKVGWMADSMVAY